MRELYESHTDSMLSPEHSKGLIMCHCYFKVIQNISCEGISSVYAKYVPPPSTNFLRQSMLNKCLLSR